MSREASAPGPAHEEVRGQIDNAKRARDYAKGFASILAVGGVWLLTMAGIVVAPWWAKVVLGVVNGMTIGVLFIVGHDAGHGSLLPNRRLNRFFGRLCLLPALHPFAAWVHNHNGLHHGFTNIKEKDPGFPPLSLDEYHALPRWRRWIYRTSRTWYGLGLLYFWDMWLKWEILPARENAPKDRRRFRRDRWIVVAFALAWIGGLVWAALAQGESVVGMLLVGLALPHAVWNWGIAFMILQQHTHPRVPWYSELDAPSPTYFQAQVRATPHIIFPRSIQFITRHIMEHTAHHADPTVPLYHLADAQQTLERAYRRDIIRILWTPGGFFRTMRTCKLYDYRLHRWIDYNGTPLTMSLLPPHTERAAAESPELIAAGKPGN